MFPGKLQACEKHDATRLSRCELVLPHVEHVEDPFAFVRELARIARPGAKVIVTTPNVLSLPSRVRTLVWGFPELFDPLPLAGADERLLTGHIHPIAPYYLALTALRA